MLEFDAGVLGRELPISVGMLGIAVSLPCAELVQEDLLVGDAAVETLRREERRVRNPPYRANWRKGLVQRLSMARGIW